MLAPAFPAQYQPLESLPSGELVIKIPTLPETNPAPPLLLCDGLGPFFGGRDAAPGTAVNWSKIPFAELERDGALDPDRVELVLAEFDRYVAAMAALGCTAVAIDDLAHLAVHDWYPAPLRRKLADYARLYQRAFAAIAAHGLRLFVLTDYCYANPAINQQLAETGTGEAEFFAESVRLALDR